MQVAVHGNFLLLRHNSPRELPVNKASKLQRWLNAEGEKATSHVTETSTPMIMQVTIMSQLVMQNTPAPLDVQRMLVLLNLADWQVPNQVAPHRYTTTVTRRAGVDRARSSGRSGSEFGWTWLQRAGRCADSAFVSGLQSR